MASIDCVDYLGFRYKNPTRYHKYMLERQRKIIINIATSATTTKKNYQELKSNHDKIAAEYQDKQHALLQLTAEFNFQTANR